MPRSVLEKLLLAYIVLIPIMVLRLPKLGSMVQLTEIVFLVLVPGWLLAWRRGEVSFPRTPAVKAWGAFLLVATLSALLGARPFGISHELPGYFYMVALYCLAVSLLRPALWLTALRAWALMSTLVAGLGVLGVLLGSLAGIQTPFAIHYKSMLSIPFPIWRLTSTFLTNQIPNMAMGYLIFGSVMTLGLVVHTRRWPWMLAFLLHALAVVLTFSRGWGAVGLGILVFLLQFRSLKVELLRWLLIALLIPMVLGIELISIWTLMHVRWETAPVRETTGQLDPELPDYMDDYLPGVPIRSFQLRGQYIPVSRTFLRQAELRLWSEKPLLGWGPGNFGNELWRRQREEGERWGGFKIDYFKDPHSTYLGGLAELGALGVGLLLVALYCTYLPLRRGLAGPHRVLAWALLGVSLADVSFALNCDMMTMRWWWMAMALASTCPGRGDE